MSDFSIISSSKFILKSFFSLLYKFRIKLNNFLAYKLEAVSGRLFIKLLTPITLIPLIVLIFPASENAEFPPCSAAKS